MTEVFIPCPPIEVDAYAMFQDGRKLLMPMFSDSFLAKDFSRERIIKTHVAFQQGGVITGVHYYAKDTEELVFKYDLRITGCYINVTAADTLEVSHSSKISVVYKDGRWQYVLNT